jgi:16S rRNA (guanine527-N7)-methyltransferase
MTARGAAAVPPDGTAEPSALLRDGIVQLGVPEPGRVHSLLEKYLDELERWNPRFGLVRAADRRELVVKHVLDSLSAWRAVRDAVAPRGATVLDVGSGAGLPGIPLAAAMPDVSVTLLDRMARRVSFLRNCCVLLGLPLLRAVQRDLSEEEGDFDVLTFRAVAPIARLLSDLAGSRVRWRTLIAYKGREDRARQEIASARQQVGAGVQFDLTALRPPFLAEERCLLIVSRK